MARQRGKKGAAGAHRREILLLENQAGHLLRRVSQRARKHMLDRIVDYDLTPMQAAALTALDESGPTSQNRLGRLIGMEPGNVTGLVRRLRKKRLIELRHDSKNIRRYVLELTPEGRSLLKEIIPLGIEATVETLAPLEPDERRQFLELLKRLI